MATVKGSTTVGIRFDQWTLAYDFKLKGSLEMCAIAYARNVVELEVGPGEAPVAPTHPGAAPLAPVDPGPAATQEELDAYQQDIAAYEAARAEFDAAMAEYETAFAAYEPERATWQEAMDRHELRQRVARVIRGREYGNRDELLKVWMLESAMNDGLLRAAVSGGVVDATKLDDTILDGIVRSQWEEAGMALDRSSSGMGGGAPIG